MKSSLATVALLVAAVTAQSTSQLPACALTCATGAIGQSGCANPTDVGCLCRSQAYLTSYASCVASSCSSTDQQSATTIGLALCASAGVTITATPSVTSSATNSAGSSSAASSASSAASSVISSIRSGNATAMSTMSSNMTSSHSSTMTGGVMSSMSSATSRASSAASAASASASSAASSASSRAAAPTQAFSWEVFGLGAAAVAAGAAALL